MLVVRHLLDLPGMPPTLLPLGCRASREKGAAPEQLSRPWRSVLGARGLKRGRASVWPWSWWTKWTSWSPGTSRYALAAEARMIVVPMGTGAGVLRLPPAAVEGCGSATVLHCA